jgi:hypothetical protein
VRARAPAALLVAVLALALPGAAASAEEGPATPPGVVVLRPAGDDRVLSEASWRVRSELDAAGLSSRMVDCPAPSAPADCGVDDASVARIALSREDGLATITVSASLPDGLELRRRVRVAAAQGGDEPAVIAIRAAELLRDIYLDIPRAKGRPRKQTPPAPVPAAPPPVTVAAAPSRPPPERRGGEAFAGVGVLIGRDGLGPDLAPYAGVAIGVGRFQAAATVAGPFSRRVTLAAGPMEPGGSSNVSQSLLTLGLRYEIARWYLRPYATVATGLHYVSVRGEPIIPYQPAVTSSSLSPLLAAGLGVSLQFGRWLFATAEVAALFSDPSVDVTIHGALVGRAGAPSVLAQAGLAIAPP